MPPEPYLLYERAPVVTVGLKPVPVEHQETPEDAPLVAKRGEGPVVTSRAAIVIRGRFTSYQVNVDGSGNNIVGDAANEPSIAVNPNDPNEMAIGWREFPIPIVQICRMKRAKCLSGCPPKLASLR